MIEVIEHQSGYRHLPKVLKAGGGWKVVEFGIFWMKRKWYKGKEPAGFVLELAQPHHVLCAFFGRLNMTVKHSRIGTEPRLVCKPGKIQPFGAVLL